MPVYAIVDQNGAYVEERFFTHDIQPEETRKHSNGMPMLVPLLERAKPHLKQGQIIDGPHHEMIGGNCVRFWVAVEGSVEPEPVRVEPVLYNALRQIVDRLRVLEKKEALTDEQFQIWLDSRAKGK